METSLGKEARAVPLSDGGEVVVGRWSWTKSMLVFDEISSLLDGANKEELLKLRGTNTYGVAVAALKIFGARLLSILRISVRETDQAKIVDEMSLEDVVAVFTAVLELNLTEGFRKNVLGLWRSFASAPEKKKDAATK